MNLLRSYEKRANTLKTWLFDRSTLTLSEAALAEQTQRDPTLSLKADRLKELADFYQLSEAEAIAIESVHNKDALEDRFQNVTTDEGLLADYQGANLLYTARLQLAYTRFPGAVQLVRHLNAQYFPWQRGDIKVLDYGCGVADYALAFATQGYTIGICDIAGGNLDFAQWRFAQRNIPVQTFPVTLDNLYPKLSPHDVVLSGELLEHVRDPLQVVTNIYDCLPSGGLFWYSGFPTDPREVGGDHLQEAADQRDNVLAFMAEHFQPATRLRLPGYLFKKR